MGYKHFRRLHYFALLSEMFTLLLNCMHVSSVSISTWCDSVWSLFGGNTRAIVRQWQWSTVRFNLTAESINIPTTKKNLHQPTKWIYGIVELLLRNRWCVGVRCGASINVVRYRLTYDDYNYYPCWVSSCPVLFWLLFPSLVAPPRTMHMGKRLSEHSENQPKPFRAEEA